MPHTCFDLMCGHRDLHGPGQQHDVSDRQVHPQLLTPDEGAFITMRMLLPRLSMWQF